MTLCRDEVKLRARRDAVKWFFIFFRRHLFPPGTSGATGLFGATGLLRAGSATAFSSCLAGVHEVGGERRFALGAFRFHDFILSLSPYPIQG